VTWSIRRATRADAEALRQFAIDSFRETYGAVNTPENMADYVANSFSPGRIAGLLADEGTIMLVLERDGVAGYAQLTRGDAMEIDRFYISSKLHGTGAAQALMLEVIRVGREDKAHSLRLGVWAQNPRAIAFYSKLGFVKVGEQTFTLGTDPQNDWVMQLPL
jgi:ribosomal protein S18 acetylase RimI-like enzyme